MNKTIEEISLTRLVADPNQPRQEFDPEALRRLEESIKREGILTPLSVEDRGDGSYLIIDGERRYRTSKKIGLKAVPAIVMKPMDASERLVKRFHLQEQHAAWTPFDKARAICLLKEQSGLKDQELADLLGVAPGTVTGYLNLMTFSKRAMNVVIEKKLPLDFLREMGSILKTIEDSGERLKVETALLDKVNTGIISCARELRKYNTAIRYGGEKVIAKIVEEAGFTPSQSLKFAQAENAMLLKSLHYNATYLISGYRNALKAKAYKEVSAIQAARIRETIEVMGEFIEKAGYVLEK